LIVGTIPAAVIGFLFESKIETTFRSIGWVGGMLIAGGIGFLLIERLVRTTKNLAALRLRDSIIIGLAQVLAFIPGISRSGSTIAAGRALGFAYADAARFSFLLSIPIVFGAGIKKFMDVQNSGVTSELWTPMFIGFLASLVVGLLTIRFLLRFLQAHSLRGFAIYRFVLGGLLIGLMLIR
jgi:undecaprenyl-diphosphatase